MAYQMNYEIKEIEKSVFIPGKKYSPWNMRWRKHYKKCMLAGIVIAVLLCAVAVGTTQGGILEWLFPGEGVKAELAMEKMLTQLQAGESLRDAFTAFCAEIIAYA